VSARESETRGLDGLIASSDGMLWQPRADHEQKQDLSGVTFTQGLDATRPITEALPGQSSEKPLWINNLDIGHISAKSLILLANLEILPR
jgi:hypothetical protein